MDKRREGGKEKEVEREDRVWSVKIELLFDPFIHWSTNVPIISQLFYNHRFDRQRTLSLPA